MWRRSLGAAAVVLLGIAIVVAPWTVRNAIVLHQFVSLSTGGGQVLYAGAYLPSDGDPEKVGAAVVEEHPTSSARTLSKTCGWSRSSPGSARTATRNSNPKALSKLGKKQLWDDIAEEPLEYAGFVAKKIGRIWSHGPRAVMREPVWEALHWALLGLGLLGLGLLVWRRRWEALLIGAVFLAITLISALLVASPRRVLVLVPLLAACAGAAVAWLTSARAKARPPVLTANAGGAGRTDERITLLA